MNTLIHEAQQSTLPVHNSRSAWALAAASMLLSVDLCLAQSPVTFDQHLDPIATWAITNNPTNVVRGDFDGDGRTDIYFHWKGPGTNRLYLSHGNGSFSQFLDPIGPAAINGNPDNLVVGDFNGDGLSDLYFHWKVSGGNRLLLSRGNGTFSLLDNPIGIAAINGSPDNLVVGDFDGDGRTDLFFHWDISGRNRLFLSRNNVTFLFYGDPIGVLAINESPEYLLVGDYDGDGRTDIYFYWERSGRNRLFLSRNNATFIVAYDPIGPTAINGYPDHVAVADFDGDGKSDVYFHWNVSGTNRLFLSRATGTFLFYADPIGVLAINESPDHMKVGDFNGDGRSDVYFHWRRTGRNRLFLSQGNGSFSVQYDPIGVLAINGYPDMMIVEDFDGNGRSDAYFYWKGTGMNRLYSSRSSCTGVGQPNSAAASLELNGYGSGSCPGPHQVRVRSGGSLDFVWRGPAGAILMLLVGNQNPGHLSLGCTGLLDIGTPSSYADLYILFDGQTNPFFRLNALGTAQHSFSLPVLPPGSLANLQGIVFQPPSVCAAGWQLTSAFYVSVY